jgi:hypothetical protein
VSWSHHSALRHGEQLKTNSPISDQRLRVTSKRRLKFIHACEYLFIFVPRRKFKPNDPILPGACVDAFQEVTLDR